MEIEVRRNFAELKDRMAELLRRIDRNEAVIRRAFPEIARVEYLMDGGPGPEPVGERLPSSPETLKGIGWAVHQLKNGRRVFRGGWNGEGMWLEWRDYTTADGTVTLVLLRTPDGRRFPWTCSTEDLLAEDWELFGE